MTVSYSYILWSPEHIVQWASLLSIFMSSGDIMSLMWAQEHCNVETNCVTWDGHESLSPGCLLPDTREASHWSIVVTWPQNWSLIGWESLNTSLGGDMWQWCLDVTSLMRSRVLDARRADTNQSEDNIDQWEASIDVTWLELTNQRPVLRSYD